MNRLGFHTEETGLQGTYLFAMATACAAPAGVKGDWAFVTPNDGLLCRCKACRKAQATHEHSQPDTERFSKKADDSAPCGPSIAA